MDPLGDFCCGTAGGVVSKFVDFPFDTVKVRMQSPTCPYSSTINCIATMARTEGIKGFYAGIAAPVVGAAFENAFVFFAFGRAKSMYRWATGVPEHADDPIPCIWFAGAFSGFFTAGVLTPVELLKCRVQSFPTEYRGVIDCGIKTVKKEGVSALFNGLSATLMRELPGNACWFGVYDLSKGFFVPPGKTKADIPWYAAPLCGGIAGIFYWSAMFPADVVKTRMQTNPEYLKLGVIRGIGRVYREAGIRGLYSGYGITVCRAFPANATVFGVYEFSSKLWMEHVRGVKRVPAVASTSS